ncbi:MAG TPA: DNA replication/repair protein RecF [Actinobacteria bacterium]|nr:DNA replication/repair protein RecF [Actinomycetota bacterium]
MYLRNVSLLNFRNHKNTSLDFSPGINLIIGENGQGKTNLLEAIYVLFNGKSYRTSLNDPLIFLKEELSVVRGNFINKGKDESVEIIFKIGETKIIKINKTQNQGIKFLKRLTNTILFSPEDLKIVKDGPDKRRDFIDEVGEQINYDYSHLKWKFLRILKHRNHLLKQVFIRKQDERTLDLWDERLALSSVELIRAREKIVEKLKPHCERIYSKVSPIGTLGACYLNEFIKRDGEDIEGEIIQKLKEVRRYEIERGVTLVGPHKDDLGLYVDGMDVRLYGSQGEQRVVSLCLKMAELELIKKEKNRTPLLLMDDVMSELDEKRRDNLSEFILNLKQSIITSTNLDYFNPKYRDKMTLIKINKGLVEGKMC